MSLNILPIKPKAISQSPFSEGLFCTITSKWCLSKYTEYFDKEMPQYGEKQFYAFQRCRIKSFNNNNNNDNNNDNNNNNNNEFYIAPFYFCT